MAGHARETWSSDGRLAMIGYYTPSKSIFATWRPGDSQIAVRAENPVPQDAIDEGFGPIFGW